MAIPSSIIEEIKYRNDIESVISSYITLKRRGKNLIGLCPFHGEKTPSFTIYPENGSFYCFGCKIGEGLVKKIYPKYNKAYYYKDAIAKGYVPEKVKDNGDELGAYLNGGGTTGKSKTIKILKSISDVSVFIFDGFIIFEAYNFNIVILIYFEINSDSGVFNSRVT